MGETFEVGEQRARNIHVHQGVSEDEFVKMRTARDAVLAAPLLLLPSIQGEPGHPDRTALNVLGSPMLDGNVPLIIERVAALHLPTIYEWPVWAEQGGGLIAYGPPVDHLADLSARFAASLLRGTVPADLPVEQPTKFELVINLKTAKAMGMTVPAALLARADKVIE